MSDAPRNESGTSMVTVLAVSSIMLLLIAVMMTQVMHAGDQTGRDRTRTQAFHVAEAGLAHAYASLATDPTFAGATQAVAAGGVNVGTFTTEVVAGGAPAERVVTSTGTAEDGQLRRITQGVTLEPLGGFNFALFSATTTTSSQHLVVQGDSFANQATTLAQHAVIVGDLVSPDDITTANNSTIDGDIRSGGDVVVASGTTVNGNIRATGTATVRGVVEGDVQAATIVLDGGTINGQAIAGSTVPVPRARTLPTFTYSPADYLPAIPVETNVLTFNAYWAANRTNMAGVFHVTDVAGTVTGPNQRTTLTGDLTIITDRPIQISRDFVSSDGMPRRLVIVSTSTSHSPPAVSLTNNITMPPNVQTFIFTNGTVSFGNQKDFHGIVYANRIEQGQFFTVTFEQSLQTTPPPGFTWDTASAGEFDLVLGVWRECNGPGGACL